MLRYKGFRVGESFDQERSQVEKALDLIVRLRDWFDTHGEDLLVGPPAVMTVKLLRAAEKCARAAGDQKLATLIGALPRG